MLPIFKAPQVIKSEQVQGFNPKPTNLVSPVRPDVDPDKARKIQELEEKKRQR